jgi:hypothetical protein
VLRASEGVHCVDVARKNTLCKPASRRLDENIIMQGLFSLSHVGEIMLRVEILKRNVSKAL